MGSKEKLLERARDELFSHINRCGVLQAAPEDQRQWMDETIDYVAERYPDLSDSQITELYNVGLRFCQPAIPHGSSGRSDAEAQADAAEGATEAPRSANEEPEPDSAEAEAQAGDQSDDAADEASDAEADNTEAEKEDATVA